MRNVNTHRSIAPPAQTNVRRRGISSLLAMLYLVLFGTLAMGFYASTTMTAQVSANDEKVGRAQLAAESGMDFMRRQLATISVSTSGTADEVMVKLHASLEDRLEDTGNLGAAAVTFDGDVIRIPSIDLGNGSSFKTEIELADPASGKADVEVRIAGAASGVSTSARDVAMKFIMSEWPTPILDFGVATRSTVAMDSNAQVRGITDASKGTILIANMDEPALTMLSNAQITGKVSLINSDNAVQKTGTNRINNKLNPVAGTAANADIKLDVEEPEFPEVDTYLFEKYAGNALYGGTTITAVGATYDTVNLRNVRIKAGTNPKFAGSIFVDGVIWVETPNKITFDSNVTVRGVIAVQENPTGEPGTDNQISFLSNAKINGLDALPTNAFFPAELKAMSGTLILAPSFLVYANSNMGAVGGNMAASQFFFDSNSIAQIRGSVINLDDYPIQMKGNANLAFGAPTGGKGPGLKFRGHFSPDLATYTEGL